MKRYIDSLIRMDWWLTAAMVALAVGSVFFIYSASYRGPGEPMPHFYSDANRVVRGRTGCVRGGGAD